MKFPWLRLILPLLAVLILLGGCHKSRLVKAPQQEARDFFQKLSESRFQEAYDSTAFSFQAQTNFKSFQATARELGLTTGTVVCDWTKEETSEREVKLTGEILAAAGTKVPMIVTLVKERGAWRIFSVRNPGDNGKKENDRFSLVGKGSAFNRSVNQEVPALPVLHRLTLESLVLFNEAVTQGNFGDFYNQVSAAWQNQLTVGQLKRAFQPFVDAKVNLRDIQGMQPVYDVAPEINTNGILLLKGHYETKPYRAFFVLQYMYEFPYWKLYGLEVQIHP